MRECKIAKKASTRRILYLILVCAFVLSGCSHTSVPPSTDYIQERGFSAEVSGEMNGQQLVASVCVTCATDSGKREARAEYASPSSLDGVTVTAVLFPQSEPKRNQGQPLFTTEAPQISRGEHVYAVPIGTIDGLLLPATVLLSLGTPASVQKGADSYTLTFENNTVLIISTDGTPLSLSTPSLFLQFPSWAWE